MMTKKLILLAASCLLVAVALVGCGDDGGEDDDFGANTSARDAIGVAPAAPVTDGQPAESAGASSTGDRAAAEQALGTSGSLPENASIDRKIVFRASMSLGVDDVTGAFDEASKIARDAGGFVEKSAFSNSTDGDDTRKSATLTLRIPVAQYDGVLASLRSMPGAKVQSEGTQATEVTEQYTDLQSRLRNLERVESQYLELLGKATSIQDILTVTDRLNAVRMDIEQTQGRIQVLDNLTDMATVDLTLAPITAQVAKNGDGPKSFRDAFAEAWDDAIEAVRYVASGAAVATVAVIWLAVPVLVLAVVARWLSRRGRTPAAS
jgi:hypothetical protein